MDNYQKKSLFDNLTINISSPHLGAYFLPYRLYKVHIHLKDTDTNTNLNLFFGIKLLKKSSVFKGLHPTDKEKEFEESFKKLSLDHLTWENYFKTIPQNPKKPSLRYTKATLPPSNQEVVTKNPLFNIPSDNGRKLGSQGKSLSALSLTSSEK